MHETRIQADAILKLRWLPDPVDTNMSIPVERTMNDRKPPRIIIAEDERASRVLLERHLQRAGYTVISCADGVEALAAVRGAGGGLIIADWNMPNLDGLALCQSIQDLRQRNELGLVYFILLTANSEKEMIVRGLEAGADEYLTKPYHARELLARIGAGQRILDLNNDLVDKSTELKRINAEITTLNQRLELLANTDALTGLVNRRCLFERLQESWSLADRKNQPLSCAMIDIDHFKSINDTHGHAAGDEVLRQVAEKCREAVRRYDICGRFGGEEFCVILPSCGLAGAVASAERLRAAIEQLEIVVDGKVIPVRASIGVAGRRASHEDADDMVADADAMLYSAKRGGRNQVWYMDENEHAQRWVSMPVIETANA
ncbi:MAG: diguanylate cyclase [Phycisphaerae bacterium]